MDEQRNLMLVIILFNAVPLLIIAVPPMLVWKHLKKNRLNRREILLAAAITSFLFNATLKEVLKIPIIHLTGNLENLLTVWVDIVTWKLRLPELIDMTYPLEKITRPVTGIMDSFPTGGLICMGSTYVALYYLLLSLKARRNTQHTLPAGERNYLYYNVRVLIMLAFSLFLVISAFIAIPYFQEKRKPSEYTRQRLDNALSGCANRDTLQSLFYQNPFIDTAFNRMVLDSIHLPIYERLSTKRQLQADEFIARLKAENDTANSQRIIAINRMEKYARNYLSRQERFRQQLLNQFETNSLSLRVDKANMYQDYLETFSQFVRNEKAYYLQGQSEIESIDAQNRHNIHQYIEMIRQSIFSIPHAANESDRIIVFPPGEPFRAYTPIETDRPDGLIPPTYTNDGKEWGLFGFIAWYLISTQSNELALLIGMFGCGILGAAVFNLRYSASLSSQPLMPDIGPVLARGLGAALLVYLASKGGFIFFTLGHPADPDGYSLLTMCFGGAVFSKKIWMKLSRSLHRFTGRKPDQEE